MAKVRRSASQAATPRVLAVLVGASAALAADASRGASPGGDVSSETALPAPHPSGTLSLEEVIAARRSVREFSPGALTEQQVSQLLWAAQGVTNREQGLRAVPSAGALYPLELYLVQASGAFHYQPISHALRRVEGRDLRKSLARAAHDQTSVRTAAVDLVIVGVVSRTSAKYGQRAERYIALEAGHAAQDLLLEATALGLGAVPVGAFDDDAVREVLALPGDNIPLYIVPVGHAAR